MTATAAGFAPVSTGPRILACWQSEGRADLAAHLAVDGPLPLPVSSGGAHVARLVGEVSRSGLTGRGGAGFPTARKLDAIRRSRKSVLVVNAVEGEPASDKDRALMQAAPHLVLDGAELVALAVGASEICLCVSDDRPDVARSARQAVAQRAAGGIGSAQIEVLESPGRYVTGEESALVSWLSGDEAKPLFRPDKSVPLTVRRRTALVQNAETLAHVALIARHGPEWFRAAGTDQAPGTTLVTISGAVERPGVYEVELGAAVGSLLEMAGLQAPPAAVLAGGYGGGWLAPHLLGTGFAPGPLSAAGCGTGPGILVAMPAVSCGVAETARVATYMAGESAGQCGPCAFGLPAIASDLADLARGGGDRETLPRLRQRLGMVAGRGACRHPDGVVRLVQSAIAVFASDFAEHARRRPCAGSNRRPLLPVPRWADAAVRSPSVKRRRTAPLRPDGAAPADVLGSSRARSGARVAAGSRARSW